MFRSFMLALCLLPIAVLTPILEISATHLFNPDWPGHARLHEAWQLIANLLLAALAMWISAARGDTRLASLIGLVLNGSFLLSVLLAPHYGGSMRHSDGTELAFGGINLAVAMIAASSIGLAALLASTRHPKNGAPE